MKISVNLLLFLLHLTTKHRKLLEELKARGAEGVEVPIFEGDLDHYTKVGKMVHDIWPDGPLTAVSMVDEKADPSSRNQRVRHRALTQLKHRIDCARALGARALVGPFTSPWSVWPKHNGKVLSADALVREMRLRLEFATPCLREAAEYAAGYGMELCAEYLNPWELPYVNTFGQARAFVESVNTGNFGILFDTAHEAAGAGFESFWRQTRAFIGRFPLRVHISAPYHRGDIVNSGIDWKLLDALKTHRWQGDLVIEIFNAKEPFASGARLNRKAWKPDQCLYIVERGIAFTKCAWEHASSTHRLGGDAEEGELV